MEIIIKEIREELKKKAVEIFTEAFIDDPLFILAFPESESRKRLTKIMYEFVVNDMVPELNLQMKGAFAENVLVGCMIYRTPESLQWNDKLNYEIDKMREKANDKRIDMIGEYARLEGYDPVDEHFYGNELAVGKKYRKSGIGKALCEYLILDCKKHPKAKGILIDTANENNIILYEKWGWVLKKTVKFYTIMKYFMWRENNEIQT
jgi:ribosomal protein S18 acetylase RimI-like enzyme